MRWHYQIYDTYNYLFQLGIEMTKFDQKMTDVNNLKILRIFSKVSLATVPIFDDWTLPGMVDSCPNSSTGQFPN